MIHIVQILLPIFIIILIGYVAGERTLGADQAKALNLFVYYFAFPALVINGLVDKSLDQIINSSFILGYLGASIVVFVGVMFARKRLHVTQRTLVALAASFPNCGYIGIPLITALFGVDMLLPAIVATVASLLHLLVAVLMLEIQAQQHHESEERNLLRILLNSLLNPMILCFIIGMLIAGAHVQLPASILRVLQLFSAACVPCALFAIGHNLALTKKEVGISWSAFTDIFLLKNFIQGILTWLLLYILHVSPPWIVVGVLMSSLSTGVVLPIMAAKYNAYQHEAPQAVFLTTIASLISLSLWVFVLQYAYPHLLWK